MTPIAPLITSFMREHMPQQRGYSPHSCETYAYSFRLLLAFVARRLHSRPSLLQLEQIDADMVLAFLHHIEHDRGNGPATRNLRLAAIKSFMRYVELRHPSALEQIAQINAIPGKRHDQKLIRHLTMDEVRAVLDAPRCPTLGGRTLSPHLLRHSCASAQRRFICAWILPKSWRQWKRSFRRRCAADGSRHQTR
jgi:integrase/recombinase XerD